MPRALRSIALVALFLAAPGQAGDPAISLMHGFIDQSSMTLWAQTERASRVAVDLRVDGTTAKPRRIEGATRAEDDFVVHLRLAGLEPGTRYRYQVLVDGKPAAEAGAFATQPLWQFRSEPPDFAVALGSCAYLNDRFSRPGGPWGGEHEIFDAIAAKAPSLILWLSDNVYFREPE